MFREYLYHLGSAANHASILTQGINPGYWSSEAGVRHFQRIKLREEPVIYRVPLRQFDTAMLQLDLKGRLDPPLIGGTIDQIEDAFFRSQQTWRDGLRLLHSIYYAGRVRVTNRSRWS